MHTSDTCSSFVAQGSPLATLEIVAPPNYQGKKVIATLKSNGRIVAQGQSRVTQFDDVRIILLTSEFVAHTASLDYELWVTLDRDGLESWYPGFGDLYLCETWHFHEGPWKQLSDASLWREKQLSDPGNRLRIHYHRYGEYSEGVGLWTWDDHSDVPPTEVFEVGRDEFGLIFDLDKADYGDDMGSLRIGFLPRIGGDWSLKEDDNKYWVPSFGDEVYLIGTVNHIWEQRPDIRQHVLAAFIDSQYCVSIQVSRPVDPGEIISESILILDEDKQQKPINRLVHGDKPSDTITAITLDPMDVGGHSYSISLENFGGTVVAGLRDVLHDAELFYDNQAQLGVTYTPSLTTFRLFAPTANSVDSLLYDTPVVNGSPVLTVPMRKIGKGIFEGTALGDMHGKFYLYCLHGPKFPPDLKVLDPYAINTVGESKIARITDLQGTNPSEWETYHVGPPLDSPVDMIIYEASVRDFTISANSGAAHKGLYLGFTELGTHLPDNPSIQTGLDHLQDLGITHVQLLPIQDFNKDADDSIYNWGYMTIAFNSPEGWFATNKFDESRICEFKQLVSGLHARNIGVILDVVYNHTDYSAPFHFINAPYFYRFFPDGNYSNGSGVGNDLRTESPMVRKYILDSLKYWVTEYGVDGFRFDLMALIDFETMREVETELRKIKPEIIVYGEPWSSDYSPMKGQATDKNAIRDTSIGAFNDHLRNAIGGSPNGSELGFLHNGSRREGLVIGLEGSFRDGFSHPAQSINYLTCHDNLVLYDKLRWFKPSLPEQDIKGMMKLGYLLLFTSQGVPFMHSGEEFARTKYGHGNSYNAGDEINRIDWSLKEKNYDLYVYTRDLIRIRKQHPLFRLRSTDQIKARVKTHLPPNEKTLIYWIDGLDLANETWRECCVLINGEDASDTEFFLPDGQWFVSFDGTGIVDAPRSVQFRVTVPRKSGLILYRMEPIAEITEIIVEAIEEIGGQADEGENLGSDRDRLEGEKRVVGFEEVETNPPAP